MKVIGFKEKQQGMVDSFILMEIIMKDNGSITNVTDSANMLIIIMEKQNNLVALNIKDNGRMIFSKVKEFKLGQMKVNTKEILRMG